MAGLTFLPERGRSAPAKVSAAVRNQLDKLLSPNLLSLETGYQRLENGMLMTSALHKMIGCKWHMIDWFVRNYNEEEYKQFHPDHVSATFHENGIRHLAEKIGGQMSRGKFQILDTADYYDLSALKEAGVGVIIARTGPMDGPAWTGIILHSGRDKGYGCEIRSRYFAGDISPEGDAAAAQRIGTPLPDMSRGLTHVLEEWAYLSTFLPALYARKHG
jgi:hypothetical protein